MASILIPGQILKLNPEASAYIYMCAGSSETDSPGMLDMVLWVKDGSWLGLTVGADGMDAGTDMIVANSDSLQVTDKHSAGYQYPSVDAS